MAMMDISKQFDEQQEVKHLQSRISLFINGFQVGAMLNLSGIRKLRGVLPLALFLAIFLLPFEGNNFFQGIVKNKALPFKKDAAYELLKNPRHNWRKFMLVLVIKIISFFNQLTDDKREKVLIIDDSAYNCSRLKIVEVLARVFDHNSGKSIKGFKLLTLGWSDVASFLPLDFVLCSSAKVCNRIQRIKKECNYSP